MNYWLAQFLLLCEVALRYVARVSALGGQVLAARDSNERDTGWMQILVFVILSIFYALGSIVKARANKTAPKGKEQIPRKPARKSPESTIDLQSLKQFWRSARATPGSQPRPQVQPKLEELPEFTAEMALAIPATVKKDVRLSSVEAPEVMRVAMPLVTAERAVVGAEMPQTKYLSEILSDYEDPEKLRRAILHYEILGKPLSLREPGEHIIGL
jgi:hypothetical protein